MIAFGRIQRPDLLQKVLGAVLVPDTVAQECLADPLKPGARDIAAAITSGLLSGVPDPEASQHAFAVLDAGESAAIGLAVRRSIAVLIDERLGRRIAANLGVAVIRFSEDIVRTILVRAGGG